MARTGSEGSSLVKLWGQSMRLEPRAKSAAFEKEQTDSLHSRKNAILFTFARAWKVPNGLLHIFGLSATHSPHFS